MHQHMAAIGDRLWFALLRAVRADAPDVSRSWFSLLRPGPLEHGCLVIYCLTNDQLRYLEENARSTFAGAAGRVLGRLIAVEFRCCQEYYASTESSNGTDFADDVIEWPWLRRRQRSDWLLENYVAGPCGRLALAAVVAVSDSPGKLYNPLLIHGPAGVGKSHLLYGACAAVQQRFPGLSCIYATCSDFSSAYVMASGTGRLEDFRSATRGAGFLALDDIQELGALPDSQEEFFHAFNALIQARAQVIIASDRPVREIPGMEARLISRLESGLTVPIDSPGYETKLAILRKKCALLCIDAPEDVLGFIAARPAEGSLGQVESLMRVDALAQEVGSTINLNVARQALGDTPLTWVTLPMISSFVGSRFGVSSEELSGRSRTRRVALPRQISMYLARQMTQFSLHDIGSFFGGRDHSTVLHAIRQVGNMMLESADFAALVEDIRQQLLHGREVRSV